MRTVPETTRTTTDLPATGGAGGAAGPGVGVGVGTGVVLSSTVNVPGPSFETARSCRPSPSKSAATTPYALGTAMGEPASAANPPPAWRNRTVTVPAELLVAARSVRPSPLKSAAASVSGTAPT